MALCGRPPFVTEGTVPLPAALAGSVMMLGSFDGMHRGHRHLLALARAEADRRCAPLAILQCDPHPRAFFAGPSRFRISPGAAQRHLLQEAGIDLIFAPRFDAGFAAIPPAAFVTALLAGRLGVAALVAGGDFRFGHMRTGDVALLQALAARGGPGLIVAGDQMQDGARISSSAIRAAISAGDLARASILLGRPWLTEVRPDPAGRDWQFLPDQILPPPGSWRVMARDGAGLPLRGATVALAPHGRLRAALPAATRLLDWIAPTPETGVME